MIKDLAGEHLIINKDMEASGWSEFESIKGSMIYITEYNYQEFLLLVYVNIVNKFYSFNFLSLANREITPFI